MTGQPEPMQELVAAVVAEPENDECRTALVEALLGENHSEEALGHIDVLTDHLPNQAWVAALEVAAASNAGDAVRAARARRRHHQLSEPPLAQPSGRLLHPSISTAGAASLDGVADGRHLRLVEGSALGGGFTHRLKDIAVTPQLREHLAGIIEQARDASVGETGPWLGGTLLYGPPGCGKAFCSSVIAGELNARFTSIDLTRPWTPSQLSEVVNRSAAQRDKTTVLLFEHVDVRNSLAPTVEMLLEALDNARQWSRVVTLGSATYPWDVSGLFVQSGRLDQPLLIPPPDERARAAFIRARFADARSTVSGNFDWLARQTENYSFADLDTLTTRLLTGGDHRFESVLASAPVPDTHEWARNAEPHASDAVWGDQEELRAYLSTLSVSH